MKKRFLLILCIFALLFGCAMVASAASTRTGYCEHCKQTVTWEPVKFGSLLTGEHKHYYFTANKTSTSGSDQIAVRGGSKLCLDLNGKTWTSYGRAMISGTNDDGAGYISLMDTVGGGAIVGMSKKTSASSGTNNESGGVLWVADTCVLNMYSGTLRLNAVETEYGLRTKSGGIAHIASGGTLNVYGGTIEGGNIVQNGAAVYVKNGGKLNVYGGTITKGVSGNGTGSCVGFEGSTGTVTLSGNATVADIYLPSLKPAQLVIDGSFTGTAAITYKSSVTLSAGTVVGTLKNSGSITGADLYCTKGFDLVADGTQLKLTASRGKRYECPACKQMVKWAVFNPSVAPTAAGSYHYYLDKDYGTSTAKQWTVKGGAVACLDLNGHSYTTIGRTFGVSSNTNSTLNLIDTVGTGIATAKGGNNNPGGGTITVGSTSTLNVYSGTYVFEHTPANSTSYGGTARGGVVQMSGTMNMYGGKLIGGEVVETTYEFTGIEGAGGAIYLNGKLNLYGGELISGIAADCGAGPCVYVTSGSTVTLSGDAKVEDICFATHKPAQLILSGTYTGSANISYAPAIALSERLVVGTMASGAVSQGQLTCGTFFVQPSDQSLVLSRFGAEDTAATGGEGYNSLQEAIDACTDGYVELLKDVPENISVSRDLRLQLNSCTVSGTVTVAEGTTLFILDSATDDYTVSDGKYGKLKTVVGNVTGAESEDGGYLTVTEAAGVSFHKVTLQIYAMTLRTDSDGQPALFYKSHFKADEKAAPLVDTYGVALSVINTPTERNLETKCAYTVFEGFESGVNGNLGNASSTLLTGILKLQNSEKDNLRNLELPIYGRAYAKTTDGQLLFGNAVCRSLSQQLQDIDGMVDSLSAVQMQLVTKLYTTFRDILKQEALPAISQAVQTEEDGTLKILILGNSHSLDATNLLYEVFRAEAPEQKLVLGALYYSGCTIEQHRNFLTGNQKVYVYYKNDGSQPDRTWVRKDSTCLEALQDEQWDIIFMQSGCRKGGTGTIFNDDWKVVADYLMNNQDIAPKLAHHFSWANPDDYELYLNDDAPYNHPTSPTSYRKTLEKYYSVDGKFNQLLEYQLGAKYTKQYIYDNHDVMGREFDFLVSNATAIQYAHEVCGRPLPELYRDYTHLNDFARVIASYHMYAAIMGIDEISEVKMDTIPVVLKHKNSQYPVADANGEYKLDAQMQADIIASVNWALANPFNLPETN